MKKNLLFLLIMGFGIVQAQSNHTLNQLKKNRTSETYISGKIVNYDSKDSLKITPEVYSDAVHYLLASSSPNGELLPDNNGRFLIKLPQIHRLTRIRIYLSNGYGDLITDNGFFLEPGDHVQLLLPATNKVKGDRLKPKWTGKGSEKYKCLQELYAIDENVIGWAKDSKGKNQPYDVDRKLKLGDSILALKLKCLKKYQKVITPESYETIKADITAPVFHNTLSYWAYDLKNIPPDVFKKRLEAYKQIANLFMKYGPRSARAICNSPLYMDWLIENAKLDLSFRSHGETFQLKDIYKKLSGAYTGVIKESLLTYYLSGLKRGDYFIPVINADQFRDCLKESFIKTKTPTLKNELYALMTLSKGADALNFKLQVDSSDRKMSLSDLKGKVILLDNWSYTCTACEEFATAFHQKVHPYFKDNPDFKVVSVMSGPSTDQNKYLRRLRNQDEDGTLSKYHYTFKDYINLFEDQDKVPTSLRSYYRINTAPFILLVDKKGKIYSSNVPFFTEPDSPNVQKLIDLIKEALAEQD